MLQLRAFVPRDRSDAALDALRDDHRIVNLVRLRGVEVRHDEDLITGLVWPGHADEVADVLRSVGVHREGAIAFVREDRVEIMPSQDRPMGYWDRTADAVFVRQVLEDARENAQLSRTYLAFMAVAGVIAGVGVAQDQSVLIVGAMAVSPDLLPLTAVCVGLVSGQRTMAARAMGTLLLGLLTAAAVAAGMMVAARVLGLLDHVDLGSNVLTSFVVDPDPASVIVALAAGVAAMLSVERRAQAAVGVAISVTTIPAAATIGVAAAIGDLDRAWGAAEVLLTNLLCISIAGSITLWLQVRGGRSSLRQTSTRPPARQ